MADTKITALAAIGANPINVATFPIPMVDLLDNSMAASGTTKKVTVNQILNPRRRRHRHARLRHHHRRSDGGYVDAEGGFGEQSGGYWDGDTG